MKTKPNPLAVAIARTVFAEGDDGEKKCGRIQFMSVGWPDRECSLGGVCEEALVRVIEKAISNYWERKP